MRCKSTEINKGTNASGGWSLYARLGRSFTGQTRRLKVKGIGGGGGGGGDVGRNLIMLTSILYNRNVFRKEELTKMVFLQMDLVIQSCSHNNSVSRNNPVKLPMV